MPLTPPVYWLQVTHKPTMDIQSNILQMVGKSAWMDYGRTERRDIRTDRETYGLRTRGTIMSVTHTWLCNTMYHLHRHRSVGKNAAWRWREPTCQYLAYSGICLTLTKVTFDLNPSDLLSLLYSNLITHRIGLLSSEFLSCHRQTDRQTQSDAYEPIVH